MVVLRNKCVVGIVTFMMCMGNLDASERPNLSSSCDTVLVQSPIIMRVPSRWDALSTLLDLVDLSVRCQDLHDGDVLHFKRPLGPFRTATIRLFPVKVNHLTGSEIWGGQVESVSATSVVQDVSWQTCVQKMRDVRQLFLSRMTDSSFDEVTTDDEMWQTETRHPGIADWRVLLSSKKMPGNSYLCSMIIYRTFVQKKSRKEIQIKITE